MVVSTYLESEGRNPFGGGGIATVGGSSVVGARHARQHRREFSVEEFSGQLPSRIMDHRKIADLRYGENPHQNAALYQMTQHGGIANAEVLSGKEMSFNNYVDADAAWNLVSDFDETACAIIKHTNPAGVGLGETPAEAYTKALATDPVSAFGGIVTFNRSVDSNAAQEVIGIFTEVVIAPEYDAAALEILQTKKNLRVLRLKKEQTAKNLSSDKSAAVCWSKAPMTINLWRWSSRL